MAAINNFTYWGSSLYESDIQLNFNWLVVFENSEFGAMFNDELPGGFNSDGSDNAEVGDICIRARTAIVPGKTVQAVTSNFMGTEVHFAGRLSFSGTLPMTFEEYIDGKGHKFIRKWQDYCFDTNSGYSVANSGYKKKINLILLDNRVSADNAAFKDIANPKYTLPESIYDKATKVITLYGVWPEASNDTSLDYTGNDSIKYDISFKFDYWLDRTAEFKN